MTSSPACASRSGWPLERVLVALAGTVTLISALLAATASQWFLVLTGFVGVNQWLFVVLGACPAAWMLGRVFGLTIQSTRRPQGVSR